MRLIEDLRDTYKHQEIWVVGPGPSLDDFPEDFFDGKISIMIRPCDVVFPNFTFSICSYDTPQFCSKFRTNPIRLKQEIFTLNPQHKKNWLGAYNKFPIFLRTLKPSSFHDSKIWPGILAPYVVKRHVKETVKHIMTKDSDRYAGIGIIQGWAIEAALVLGAAKVTLAGCEGRVTKFRWHAKRVSFFYAQDPQRLRPSANGFSKVQLKFFAHLGDRMQKEIQWFVTILKPYRIEISRYFYGEGYRKI